MQYGASCDAIYKLLWMRLIETNRERKSIIYAVT